MINVTRNNEDSNQKLISTFLKRVKKSNLVARKRKTQFAPAKVAKLRKKRKALSRIDYDEKQKMIQKTAKI
jgi:hypothetical protein